MTSRGGEDPRQSDPLRKFISDKHETEALHWTRRCRLFARYPITETKGEGMKCYQPENSNHNLTFCMYTVSASKERCQVWYTKPMKEWAPHATHFTDMRLHFYETREYFCTPKFIPDTAF